MSMADRQILLDRANVINAVIPGGTLVKTMNVKFGRSMVDRSHDGYRKHQKVYCLLVPNVQAAWLLEFTATEPGSVARVS